VPAVGADLSLRLSSAALGILAALLAASVPAAAAIAETSAPAQQRIERVLAQTPLVDGHNDLPWERLHGLKPRTSMRSDAEEIHVLRLCDAMRPRLCEFPHNAPYRQASGRRDPLGRGRPVPE